MRDEKTAGSLHPPSLIPHPFLHPSSLIPHPFLVLGGVLLGSLYFVTDYREAVARRDVVQEAVRLIPPDHPGASVWFLGHWGFAFYAEEAGMKPLVPDQSRLRAGDWLVVPVDGVHIPEVRFGPDQLELAAPPVVGDDRLPLATVRNYYGTGTPLAYRDRPRVTVAVCRVRVDGVAASDLTPAWVAAWAARRGRPVPPAAAAVLRRLLDHPDPTVRREAAQALEKLPPACR
jgi:hypothetical protein